MRETFQPSTDHGGEDGEGRSLRYIEWSYDPDENDTTYVTDYVVMCREANQPIKIVHDHHVQGLFAHDEWLRLLRETGFEADFVVDPFERHVFAAHKP